MAFFSEGSISMNVFNTLAVHFMYFPMWWLSETFIYYGLISPLVTKDDGKYECNFLSLPYPGLSGDYVLYNCHVQYSISFNVAMITKMCSFLNFMCIGCPFRPQINKAPKAISVIYYSASYVKLYSHMFNYRVTSYVLFACNWNFLKHKK